MIIQHPGCVIQLPLMQRNYVWKPATVIELLESLYNKWPIGIFYIWQTPTAQETTQAATSPKHFPFVRPLQLVHYSLFECAGWHLHIVFSEK